MSDILLRVGAAVILVAATLLCAVLCAMAALGAPYLALSLVAWAGAFGFAILACSVLWAACES